MAPLLEVCWRLPAIVGTWGSLGLDFVSTFDRSVMFLGFIIMCRRALAWISIRVGRISLDSYTFKSVVNINVFEYAGLGPACPQATQIKFD